MSSTTKNIVFSGIQPTGQLHLGNYVGAIRNWVAGQDTYFNILCVVDLHAITVQQDPAELRESTRRAVGTLIACGLDPDRCLLYVQSHVTAHAELAWILNCITPVGWLQRMTQYKEKAKTQDSVSTGLLAYPVLQAADILLFSTDHVPTGEDQRAHIELARDIAGRFNMLFGDVFKLPKPVIPAVGARIMGLDEPTVKMSKSIMKSRPNHGVAILDEPKRIQNIFKRAVTDSGADIVFSDDPNKAGVNNLLTIYQSLTGKTSGEVVADFADARGYGALKLAVAEVVIETLKPVQARFAELMNDPGYLDDVLSASAAAAEERCQALLQEVKDKVGFLPRSRPR